MVNNPGNARLVVVFYSSPNYITEKSKVGMSGGNRIFLESIKRWKKKFSRIEILTCKPGEVMLDANLGSLENISINVMRVPRLFFRNLFVLFLYKTIVGSWLAVTKTIRSREPVIIFSTSDIFPDSIEETDLNTINPSSEELDFVEAGDIDVQAISKKLCGFE